MWETSALRVLFVFSFNFYIFLACLVQDKKAWTSSSQALYMLPSHSEAGAS